MLNKLLDEPYWDELDLIVKQCLIYCEKIHGDKISYPVQYTEKREASAIFWILHLYLTDFAEPETPYGGMDTNCLLQNLPRLSRKIKKAGFDVIKEEIKSKFNSISFKSFALHKKIDQKGINERFIENHLFSNYVNESQNIQEIIDTLLNYKLLNEEMFNA